MGPGTDRQRLSLRATVSPWHSGDSSGDTPGSRGALSITRGTDGAPEAWLQPAVTLHQATRTTQQVPTLAREGRQPLCFLLSLSLATHAAQPARTHISRSEGRSPQGSAGAGPAQPSTPEWGQPGCRSPHTTVTPGASSSPPCAQSRGRPPSPGRALPHTSTYKPPSSRGREGVSAWSRARGTRGGSGWVQGPEDRDRGTALPAGEPEAGRGVHRREHALRPRNRWPADLRGQPSGPGPADCGVGCCS